MKKKKATTNGTHNYRIYKRGEFGFELVDVVRDEAVMAKYKANASYHDTLIVKHHIGLNMDELEPLETFKEVNTENKVKSLSI